MREETYDVIVTAGGFSSNAINPNHITELLRYSVPCSTQRGLNTKSPTLVFFLDPTKPLQSYDR